MTTFLPSDVGRLCMRDWTFPRHLQALQSAVLRLIDDPGCNRLLVEMPVRHGKSYYAVWAFVTWYLLTRPHRNVILSTYGKEFSGEWSRKVQNTIRDYGRRLTGVIPGRTQKQDFADFRTADGGGGGGSLRTASPGTGIAGKGCDLLVIDDLVKDVKEAVSPTRRNSLDRWVNSELLTRLEPDGKTLAIMSRRHEDDQSGRWLAQNSDLPPAQQWHRITLQAISGQDGSALWPERWPLEKLLAEKARYELAGMSWLFSCLYQQDPRGDASIIEWPDHYFEGIGYDELPPDLAAGGKTLRWRLLALDPSKGRSDRPGDYSSLPEVVVDRDAVMWADPWLRILPTEAVEDEVVGRLSRRHYDAIMVETNGFQSVIADNIVRKCHARGIHCPMFTKDSTENKEVRIRLGLGPLLEQKRIRLKTTSSSYRLALQQLREFPSAAHDDFPDSMNLCCDLINWLLKGKR